MKCKAISLVHARADNPFVSIIIHTHGPATVLTVLEWAHFKAQVDAQSTRLALISAIRRWANNAQRKSYRLWYSSCGGRCGKVLSVTSEQQIMLCDCRKDTWITEGVLHCKWSPARWSGATDGAHQQHAYFVEGHSIRAPPPHSFLWLIKTDWHALMKSPDFTNMKREREEMEKKKKSLRSH